MKATVFAVAAVIAAPALADPGHFAESQGHSHWLAAGALALAAVIGAVALWRGCRKKAEKKA